MRPVGIGEMFWMTNFVKLVDYNGGVQIKQTQQTGFYRLLETDAAAINEWAQSFNPSACEKRLSVDDLASTLDYIRLSRFAGDEAVTVVYTIPLTLADYGTDKMETLLGRACNQARP